MKQKTEHKTNVSINETPLAKEIQGLRLREKALSKLNITPPSGHYVFTISNQKGGVGKTTTTVNLAAAMATFGVRTLVIDLDPQGNASSALGVDHHADTPSIYDVILGEMSLGDVIQASTESPLLSCVPSTIHLSGAEIELVSRPSREFMLKNALDQYLGAAAKPPHFVFIDCPPSLGVLTVNAFAAASDVLIPIQCEYYALEGLSQLLNTITMVREHINPRISASTILRTMYDSRTRLAQQVSDEVRQHFPEQVLDTIIPRSVRLSEAPSFSQTIIAYDGHSAGAIAYREAAAEIVNRVAHATSPTERKK